MQRKMFYGAGPEIFARAKKLRATCTPAEIEMWKHLRESQLGLKFRRQHPLANYIADFYCHKVKLVVEIDGSIHKLQHIKAYDEGRTYAIEQLGIKVLRFSNEEVFSDIETVIEKIKNIMSDLRQEPG
ncbi:endonuclease domain-containing protein [Catalinimonas sp. 4WD22]|uniref:endonuclease domain-containing protein n=1 Tax=Catalinimonas locisalis TaxID=3133978 RepID=UPI0031013F04